MTCDPDAIVAAVRDMIDAPGASRDDVLRRAIALLAERDGYDWTGVYLLEGDTLVLGPYVGKPTEHTRIPVGRGVCGTAVAERHDIVVDDVTKLDNYLACSLETRSEIVVLIRRGDRIFGQIDVDSDRTRAFGDDDRRLLLRVAAELARLFA